HVIADLIRKMSADVDKVVLWGDGSPTREFLYVEDCAEGFVLAAERYDGGEPVNLGAGKEISIRELAELVADVVGFEGTITWDASMPNGQPRRSIDATRAKELFGFEARTPLREGIEHTVVWYRSALASQGAGRTLDRLLERPRTVLATLAGAQIVATIVLALRVQHNGWVYYQGGDQIWFSTTGWLLGRQQLAPTVSSYLWPLVQAPITWVTGPTYVQLLPVLVVLNVAVLGPIGLLCVYAIAARIGGRLLGYWGALLWVVAPYAAIPLFVERYHEKWTEQFLPQATGLTAMADYPSMIVVLAAALFVARSLSPGRISDAALAGLFLGAAGGLKPPNLLVGVGAALAYALARRWREALAFAAAVAACLLVLAFWKERSLGALPLFAVGQARLAAGAAPVALDLSIHKYVNLDVNHRRISRRAPRPA
ncbi:MAG: NAD-dependent epimerase/dehydratase family protein, partial [Actinobacteria bacterium]